jgi:cell division protein FtsB
MYKALIVVLVLLLLGLQYRLWVGENSLAHISRLEKEITQQQIENNRLNDRNQVLAAEVKALKSGLDAVEERARGDLGMIKENETFFMVIERSEEK